MTVIDDYLKKIEPGKRRELERIRRIARKIVPEEEEAIAYGMPTLKYHGRAFLGFDAHLHHIGIYPFSGEVIEVFKEKLTGFEFSKGAIRVLLDKPIPEELLKELILYRLEMIKRK